MLNSALAGALGRGRLFAYSSIVHEQAQLNRVHNIFNFVMLAFFRDSDFLCFNEHYYSSKNIQRPISYNI
jgi:hypothetical protein